MQTFLSLNIQRHHIHYGYCVLPCAVCYTALLLCAALCCVLQPGTAANCLSLKAHDRKQFKGKELLTTGPGHILQLGEVTERTVAHELGGSVSETCHRWPYNITWRTVYSITSIIRASINRASQVSLADALNCAETLFEFLEQESNSNFSDMSQAPHINKVEKEQEN
jgi:hypothetical protein